ncbi:unnamed protein product, partial [Porites evermanni]
MLVLLVNMFLAITFDLKYFTWKTNKKAIIIVLVEWLVGFSCAVLSCLNCDVDLQQDASILTYRRERKQLNLPRLQAEARLQKDIQAAKVIIIIVLVFLGCYFPLLCMIIWRRSNSHSTDNTWNYHLVHTSILTSSGINPIIYCFRTSRFRCALKQFLNDPCG